MAIARRTVLWTLVSNFLVPAGSLLTGPLLARALGPEDRGYLAAITVPLFLISVMGTFGLQDAFTQYVARRGLSASTAIRIAVRSLLLCSLISAAGIAATYWALLGRTPYLFLALSTIGAVVFNIGANFAAGIANGLSEYRLVNIIKVATTITRTALIVCAFAVNQLTLDVAVLIQAYAGCVGLLVILLPLWRRARGAARTPLAGAGIVRFGLVLWLGVIANVSSARLDQVVGLPLIGAHELGIYAACVAIAEITTVVAGAARMFILGPGDGDQFRVARAVLLVCVLASAAIAAASPLIVPVLLGPEFQSAVIPLVLCCVAAATWNIVTVCASICIRVEAVKGQSIALLATAVLNICLLVAFGPLGARGAALASILSYAVGATVLTFVLGRALGQSWWRVQLALLPRRDTFAMLATGLDFRRGRVDRARSVPTDR